MLVGSRRAVVFAAFAIVAVFVGGCGKESKSAANDAAVSTSADGRAQAETFVFVQPQPGNADDLDTTPADIFTLNADGTGLKQLTDGPRDDVYAHWSPDGEQLAFVRDFGGVWDVMVMDADGSGERRLTRGDDAELGGWSPDGRSIWFSRIAEDDPTYETYDEWIMDADGGNQRLWIDGDGGYWSPDGRWLAYYGLTRGDEWSIWLADGDGTGGRRLVKNAVDFAWSSDSRSIAFERNSRPTALWVINTDGSGERKLVVDPASTPVWSPVARTMLVFGGHTITVIDADTGAHRRLVLNLHPDWDEPPVWSPDGTKVAYLCSAHANPEFTNICVVNADGGGKRRLTNARACDFELSFSPSGNLISFTRDRSCDPGYFSSNSLFVMNSDGSQLRQVAEHALHLEWQPVPNPASENT